MAKSGWSLDAPVSVVKLPGNPTVDHLQVAHPKFRFRPEVDAVKIGVSSLSSFCFPRARLHRWICVTFPVEMKHSWSILAFFNNPNDPNKPKPGFGFGQSSLTNPTTPGQSTSAPQQPQQTAFGVSSTPAGNPSSGGVFGQQQLQQQQPGSAFGGQQSGFGAQTSGSGFGSQTGGTTTPGGGAFGAANTSTANKLSMFGAGLNNPPSAFGGGTSSAFGGTIHLVCKS